MQDLFQMAHLSQLISFGLQNVRQTLVSCNNNLGLYADILLLRSDYSGIRYS